MIKIYKLFKLLNKIKFLEKKKYKDHLIIYDCTSFNELELYLLKDLNYFIISNRIEKIKIYFSFGFLFYFIKRLKNFVFNKEIFLQDVYFLSLIEYIQPKVVLTAIDVSPQLSKISKYSKKNIKYITLQLTNLPQRNYITYLFKNNLLKKNLNNDYYFPIYLGFGNYQKKNMEINQVKFDKFTDVGSLKLANFIKSNNLNLNNKIYDICLISDINAYTDKFGPHNIQFPNLDNIEQSFIKLTKWTIKLVKEQNLKFVFVFKRKIDDIESFKEENLYFKKLLNKEEYDFLIQNSSYKSKNNPYNSYTISFRSKLSLAVTSTLLTENFIYGNKVLSCNFTGLDVFDFPINGNCSLKSCNYEIFREKILKVLKLDKDEYFNNLSEDRNYLGRFTSPEKTFNLIKDEIIKFL